MHLLRVRDVSLLGILNSRSYLWPTHICYQLLNIANLYINIVCSGTWPHGLAGAHRLTVELIWCSPIETSSFSLMPHIKPDCDIYRAYLTSYQRLNLSHSLHGICSFKWLCGIYWTIQYHAIHHHTPGWHVKSLTLWLMVTKLLFTVIIIVIKQSKADGILGVCLCLSSLFLFEGNLMLINCVWRAHLYVCVGLRPCYFTCICGRVCFLELRGNLLTGSVSGGGQWRFWDRHKRRVSESGREKEGLFHVTPHSTKAQAGRGTRRDMRPPSSLPLPPPPLHPLPCPPLPIQPPPLPSASDLNIYQRTTCWNSSSASVSWWESQSHTHTWHRHT